MQRAHHRISAGARRVDQHFVRPPPAFDHGCVGVEQIGTDETGVADAVGAGIVCRAARQFARAFHAQHPRRPPCQRQAEIAQPTKQVDYRFMRPHIQQRQSTRHHQPVQRQIDLGKVARPERHGQTKLRQAVVERRRIGRERLRRIAPVLLPQLPAGFQAAGKRRQRGGGQRLAATDIDGDCLFAGADFQRFDAGGGRGAVQLLQCRVQIFQAA